MAHTALYTIIFALPHTVLSYNEVSSYFGGKDNCGMAEDRALEGDGFRDIHFITKERCINECVADIKCRSVNYSKTKKRCELFTGIASTCNQLQHRSGYQYYEKKVSLRLYLSLNQSNYFNGVAVKI